jgi:serpin B
MRKTLLLATAATVLMTGLVQAGSPRSRSKEDDVSAVVKGNTEFAFALYGKLRIGNGNLIYSPASVSSALAMTYAGARGDTADVMAKTLHFNLPPDELHPAFGALLKELNGTGKNRGYQLSVANALWGQKGLSFKDDFIRLTRDDYGGGLREVDFAGNADAARKQINAWVEKQTQDHIRDLLSPTDVTRSTRLVLTNAVYFFKGDWQHPFKEGQTHNEPFFTADGGSVSAPLMHQTARFRYHEADSLRVLELPYSGKELSMVVLLPKAADGLGELEKSLSADKRAGWVGKLREQEVIVSLPKFKTTSEFRLKGPLTALGMGKAFRGGDFSGITAEENLPISDVVHKAYVDVNEEGTEAAAATGVVARAMVVTERPVFRADHPFVFLIRDTRNGSVLFLGRVVNPTR